MWETTTLHFSRTKEPEMGSSREQLDRELRDKMELQWRSLQLIRQACWEFLRTQQSLLPL